MLPPGAGNVTGVAVMDTKPPTPPMDGKLFSAACTCAAVALYGRAVAPAVGVFDLRILGMAKGLPVGPIQRLMPWAILGFLINLVTGFLFFAGDPFQYIHNIAFAFKLLFIALAGVNVIVFYVTGLYRHVDGIGPGHDAPLAAKFVAAASLFLWIGVMYWGRMLPFIGNAF